MLVSLGFIIRCLMPSVPRLVRCLLSTLVTIVTVAHFPMWHHGSTPVVGQCILISFGQANHDHAHLAGAKRCDMTNHMGVEQICLHKMRYSEVSCLNTVLLGLFDKGGLSSVFIAVEKTLLSSMTKLISW